MYKMLVTSMDKVLVFVLILYGHQASSQCTTDVICSDSTSGQTNGCLPVEFKEKVMNEFKNLRSNILMLRGQEMTKTQTTDAVMNNCTTETSSNVNDVLTDVISTSAGDCAGVLTRGGTKSGVYIISLKQDPSKKISVYCDMITSGGGWLVFQSRQNGAKSFNRTWVDYRNGFGNLKNEFWLGNDYLHQLTRLKSYRLRVDLEDRDGARRYAEYDNFSVASEDDKYQLSFTGYRGDAGDSLAGHNGKYFTTIDRDNDQSVSSNCAVTFGGGWWFDNCHRAHLNGQYGDNTYAEGINWFDWRGHEYSLKATEMKIKPM